MGIVCTGYCCLMSTLTPSYCNRPNALLSDAQLKGEHDGGYRMPVGADGYSLCIGEVTSDEERGNRPSTPNSVDYDIIQFFCTPSDPSPAAFYYSFRLS